MSAGRLRAQRATPPPRPRVLAPHLIGIDKVGVDAHHLGKAVVQDRRVGRLHDRLADGWPPRQICRHVNRALTAAPPRGLRRLDVRAASAAAGHPVDHL